MNGRYRHLFWDMGGTLVDTYPGVDGMLADVVRRHGHAVTPDEVGRLSRVSTRHAIDALAERFGIDAAEFEAANAALKQHWKASPAPAMKGARELMDDLRAAGGLNLVVTHRERSSALSLVEGLGLHVDDMLSVSDGYPRKPDPTMHRVLLERHGLSPDDCLAVGDRAIDADAARAAGIVSVMLANKFSPDPAAADHTLENLDGLRPMLGLEDRA